MKCLRRVRSVSFPFGALRALDLLYSLDPVPDLVVASLCIHRATGEARFLSARLPESDFSFGSSAVRAHLLDLQIPTLHSSLLTGSVRDFVPLKRHVETTYCFAHVTSTLM